MRQAGEALQTAHLNAEPKQVFQEIGGFSVDLDEQEAEQLRQTSKGEADAAVIASEGKAKAILVEAAAQAEALRQLGEALKTSPDLLQYTYVQELSDDVEIMLLPANSPYLFNLPELEGMGDND